LVLVCFDDCWLDGWILMDFMLSKFQTCQPHMWSTKRLIEAVSAVVAAV
jgi:hypothetical protein